MRFAYADPPYLGMCARYGHNHPEGDRPFDGLCWDESETHRLLLDWLCAEFPDGWAYSLSAPSLSALLPFCPADARVCAWVKPFAAFKKHVTQAFAWEPVIVRPLRRRPEDEPTVRDWVAVPITLQRGTVGAKPAGFSRWLFEFAGLQTDDEFMDVFAGSGAVAVAYERWRVQSPLSFAPPMDASLAVSAETADPEGECFNCDQHPEGKHSPLRSVEPCALCWHWHPDCQCEAEMSSPAASPSMKVAETPGESCPDDDEGKPCWTWPNGPYTEVNAMTPNLIPCRSCGTTMSKSAAHCPKCGQPGPYYGLGGAVFGMVAVVLFLFLAAVVLVAMGVA